MTPFTTSPLHPQIPGSVLRTLAAVLGLVLIGWIVGSGITQSLGDVPGLQVNNVADGASHFHTAGVPECHSTHLELITVSPCVSVQRAGLTTPHALAILFARQRYFPPLPFPPQ